jgi:hypothetical protein
MSNTCHLIAIPTEVQVTRRKPDLIATGDESAIYAKMRLIAPRFRNPGPDVTSRPLYCSEDWIYWIVPASDHWSR